jgi:hypothetical protein
MAQKISTFDDWTDYFSKWQRDNGFLSRSAPIKVYDFPVQALA